MFFKGAALQKTPFSQKIDSKWEAFKGILYFTNQRNRTASMMSVLRFVDCVSFAGPSTNSFLKYSANVSFLHGEPKTPAKRSGRTHMVASLSATTVLGLKPDILSNNKYQDHEKSE